MRDLGPENRFARRGNVVEHQTEHGRHSPPARNVAEDVANEDEQRQQAQEEVERHCRRCPEGPMVRKPLRESDEGADQTTPSRSGLRQRWPDAPAGMTHVVGERGKLRSSERQPRCVRRPSAFVGVTCPVTLVLTGLLAFWSVHWTRLSGFGAEEASFLQAVGFQIDTQGLLLAGVIIGTLGALDDIAVGQSSTIFELNKANPALGWRTLFSHGMTVGRDHIAAMVNTLFLAYVGAALPLMLVFSIYQEPLWRRINREPIAEEIVRTLAGSVGLVLAVPITGLIASLVARWAVRREEALAMTREGGEVAEILDA